MNKEGKVLWIITLVVFAATISAFVAWFGEDGKGIPLNINPFVVAAVISTCIVLAIVFMYLYLKCMEHKDQNVNKQNMRVR